MYNNGLLLQHYIKKSLSCCFIFSLCLSVGVIIQCVLHKVDVDVVADVGRRFCRSWTAPHQERIHHTHTSLLSSSSSRFFGIAPSFPRLYVLNTYTHLYVRVGSYHTMGGFEQQGFAYLKFQNFTKAYNILVSIGPFEPCNCNIFPTETCKFSSS